jgi:hypothetical protein
LPIIKYELHPSRVRRAEGMNMDVSGLAGSQAQTTSVERTSGANARTSADAQAQVAAQFARQQAADKAKSADRVTRDKLAHNRERGGRGAYRRHRTEVEEDESAGGEQHIDLRA